MLMHGERKERLQRFRMLRADLVSTWSIAIGRIGSDGASQALEYKTAEYRYSYQNPSIPIFYSFMLPEADFLATAKCQNSSRKLSILILLYTSIAKSVGKEAFFLKLRHFRRKSSSILGKIPRKRSKSALKNEFFDTCCRMPPLQSRCQTGITFFD